MNLVDAHCWRGDALLFLGSTSLAMADFEKALELDAESAWAYHGRANARKLQGNAEGAMADLEEALRLKPRLPAALIDRGILYREDGSIENAIRDFGAALQGSSRGSAYTWFRDGHFYRGVARCLQRDWLAAEKDLELARGERLRVASSFGNIFGGVATFEEEHGLKLPSLITTQLYVAEE